MYGRRDLVDAHLFLRGRLSAAVLRSDPDAPDRPLRRTSTGMGIGIAVAAAALVVVVVLNIFLFTTNDGWRDQPGALLVDESTGSRYMLIDGTLHPVMNVASAALLAGAPPAVIQVSSEDLASVPRGEAVGTEGLPDELPGAQPTPPEWAACAAVDGTALAIGAVEDGEPVADDEAVLVTSDGDLSLVWQGVRSQLAGPWVARAIGFEPNAAVPVEAAWLDTIPIGRDLDLSELRLGGEGPTIAGEPTTLGQVVETDDGARYAVTRDGLTPITETVAALLTTVPDLGLPEPRIITPRDLVATTVADPAAWQSELPETPPTPVATGLSPCSVWAEGETSITVVDAASLAESAGVVAVAPGSGHLVATAAAPGVSGAGLYLVTDDGTKHPVADTETAGALGLDASSSPAVPAALLALLPTGPTIAT